LDPHNFGGDDMLTIYIDIDDVLCDYSSKIKEHRQKILTFPFRKVFLAFFEA